MYEVVTDLGVLYKSDIFAPNLARLPIHPTLLQRKFIRFSNDSALGLFVCCTCPDEVLTPDIV